MSLKIISIQLSLHIIRHPAEWPTGMPLFLGGQLIYLLFPNALSSPQLAQVHALLPCCNPEKNPNCDCKLSTFNPNLYNYDYKIKVRRGGWRKKASGAFHDSHQDSVAQFSLQTLAQMGQNGSWWVTQQGSDISELAYPDRKWKERPKVAEIWSSHLSWSGIDLIFFLVAGMGPCNRFSMRTMLTTHWQFSCC